MHRSDGMASDGSHSFEPQVAPAQPEQQQIGQPKGWDERDYKLSSKISCLQSYGLLPGKDNRMISSNGVLALLAEAAEERYAQKRTA